MDFAAARRRTTGSIDEERDVPDSPSRNPVPVAIPGSSPRLDPPSPALSEASAAVKLPGTPSSPILGPMADPGPAEYHLSMAAPATASATVPSAAATAGPDAAESAPLLSGGSGTAALSGAPRATPAVSATGIGLDALEIPGEVIHEPATGGAVSGPPPAGGSAASAAGGSAPAGWPTLAAPPSPGAQRAGLSSTRAALEKAKANMEKAAKRRTDLLTGAYGSPAAAAERASTGSPVGNRPSGGRVSESGSDGSSAAAARPLSAGSANGGSGSAKKITPRTSPAEGPAKS